MDIKNNSCKDYTSDFIRVIKKNYIDFLEEINKKDPKTTRDIKNEIAKQYMSIIKCEDKN